MISLLVTFVVIVLVCYFVWWALAFLGAPEPLRKIATVLIVFLGLCWLLYNVLPLAGHASFRW